jgi:hypothetical protein
MEDVGVFCGHSVNSPAIWYIYCGNLVHLWSFSVFPRLGMLYHEKSGNPGTESDRDSVKHGRKNLTNTLILVIGLNR